jgi:uncharacterized membrane protein
VDTVIKAEHLLIFRVARLSILESFHEKANFTSVALILATGTILLPSISDAATRQGGGGSHGGHGGGLHSGGHAGGRYARGGHYGGGGYNGGAYHGGYCGPLQLALGRCYGF